MLEEIIYCDVQNSRRVRYVDNYTAKEVQNSVQKSSEESGAPESSEFR
jgi:hypothetical protein